MTDERDVAATRRETAPTRRDVAATRRDQPTLPRNTHVLTRLPSALASRLTIVSELAEQGVEADVLHVRDAGGTDFVAKIYRRGFTVDRNALAKLQGLDTRHIVHVHETGESDGRAYELLEYVPGGNLETLRGQMSGNLPPAQVAQVVEQLAAALEHLHLAGIVHRDLKPANVLVRRQAPLDLVLSDFGLSRSLDVSMLFASTSRTLAYAAPESLAGQVSPARDWWSLGMMVRQLATGERPFEQLSETAVVHHLATRPIDVEGIADPRLRLLCQGLLVRDPQVRWGAREVRRWLEGESPAVPEEPATTSAASKRPPLRFKGESYTEKRPLARALATNWEAAARRYFAAMGTAERPSESWRLLRDWLVQFDDPEHDDVEGRIELTDLHLTGATAPDAKLVHLLRWLDPELPPVYRGLRLLPEDLPTVAAQALADSPDGQSTRRIVDDLWKHHLLEVLSGFRGAGELIAIDQRWREQMYRWSSVAKRGGALPDHVSRALSQTQARARLLALAAAPEQERRRLAQQAEATVSTVRGAVPWLERLADTAAGDPVGLLTVVMAEPHATAELERTDLARRQTEAAAAARREEWARVEAQRTDGRGSGVGWAALGSGLLVVPALFGLAGEATGSGWAVAVPAGIVLAGCGVEFWLAWTLAGDYHPRWSWVGWTGRALPMVGGWLRAVAGALGAGMSTMVRSQPACGCVIIGLALLFVLPLAALGAEAAVLLWGRLAVLVCLCNPVLVWIRLRGWRAEQERRRAQLLGVA